MAYWTAQPGPQAKAVICPADFTFFGGSRGGGKSDCLIGRQLAGVENYGQHWNGLIVRRKYKDFAEIRRRFRELIIDGLPAELIGGDQQVNKINFKGGAKITLPAISRLEMVNDFVGHQYTEISVDECTTFPFFSQMIDKLKGSLRSPHGVPCRMFGTGNPGGPGHNEVKSYFQLGSDGVTPETVTYDEAGESRVFIPSFLDDNRILCDNDPKYVNRLKSIADPALRRAWIDGDWDVFIGQAFNFVPQYHVINPIPVPRHAQKYMTFDWGYGKPFSIGWWWVDGEGCLYRFSEWYGFTGQANQGLRLTDAEIAEGIKEKEDALGITGQTIIRLCDPTSFSKKPDYKGGGQGPSTAEVFANHGIYLSPGDPSRVLKIRQFRERFRLKKDEQGKLIEHPMIQIYRTCKQFIRTIPALCMDENNPEDIDCFVAGTLISTPNGEIPIEKINVGQIVDTPLGPRKVTKAYSSGKSKTCTINMSNGISIEGTYLHEIFIKNAGLLPLYLISSGDEINTQEDLICQPQFITKKSDSPSVKIEDILSVAQAIQGYLEQHCYIEQYGKIKWDQYQKGIISTIKTTMSLTTALKTLNSFLRVIMRDNITKKERVKMGISRWRYENGAILPWEKLPLERILKSALQILPVENLRALIVALYLKQSTQPENIAQQNATKREISERKNAPSAGKLSTLKNTTQEKRKPVVISVVGSLEEKEVYNITIEQSHLFYANGVLSSNTDQEDHIYDESCHVMMARPIAMQDPVLKPGRYDQRIDALEKGTTDNYELAALQHQNDVMSELDEGHIFGNVEYFEDNNQGRLIEGDVE